MSDDDDDDVHCPIEDDRLSGGRKDGRTGDGGHERAPAGALWLNRVRAGVRKEGGRDGGAAERGSSGGGEMRKSIALRRQRRAKEKNIERVTQSCLGEH